jgi:hypothetical protein
MEGMETSNQGVVRTGRQHAATPRGLVRRTQQKAGMVSGCEGTGTLAPSAKHWTTVICHPRQRRSRATQTSTSACCQSDPMVTICRDQRTDTHTHTAHNTIHTTGSVCVGHRRSVPRLAKTCAAFGDIHWGVPNTRTVGRYQRSGSYHSNGWIRPIWSRVP